jgi:hypothetical protein
MLGLKKMPIEDIDYVLMTSPNVPGVTIIKLLTGEFAGALYSYEYVRVSEEASIGAAKLSFNYTLYTRLDVSNNPKFHHYAGDLLAELLSSEDAKIGN